LTTGADSVGEVLEHSDGILPANASISDADTTLEGSRTLGRNLLVTLANVGLNHDTDDCLLTLTELVTNNLGNLGLVLVVLGGVAWDELVVRVYGG
jgi:hypothetical protein